MYNWKAILVRLAVTFVQVAAPLIYVNGKVDLSQAQNAIMLGGAAVLSLAWNLFRQRLDARQDMPNLEGAPQDAGAVKRAS